MRRRKCHPSSIRVWRGFRSERQTPRRETFEELLGSIFVPQTVQQLTPLGLQAYFPAVLDERTDAPSLGARVHRHVPDEVALVVYPSRAAYDDATRHSVAGRAYGRLHSTLFEFGADGSARDGCAPPSKSGFPAPWKSCWQPDTPYFLVDAEIDWWGGCTSLLAARPSATLPLGEFRTAFAERVDGWLDGAREGVDGAIFCATEDCLLYWEHRTSACRDDSLVPHLLPLLEPPLVDRRAEVRHVPHAFRLHDDGLKITAGDVLDVRLSDSG